MGVKIDWAAFDSAWYKKQYQSVLLFLAVDTPQEIQNFYEQNGSYLKHSPNPFFDEVWYLTRYPMVQDLIAKGEYKTGFEHYKQVGFLSHSPHWLFDEDYYTNAPY